MRAARYCRNRYSPLGDLTSSSRYELDFRKWLKERKLPAFEMAGLDHTEVSLRPVQQGAMLECLVCFKDGKPERVEAVNEIKKHRHELSKKHCEAIAELLGVYPEALIPEEFPCENCHQRFGRRDSLDRHVGGKICFKALARTIVGADPSSKKRRITRNARSPTSDVTSEEDCIPSPLPYPLALPSPSRYSPRPFLLYKSTSETSPPSASSASSLTPLSSSSTFTSREISTFHNSADEYPIAFESAFPSAKSFDRFPTAESVIGILDAYAPLEDEFPTCALANDFFAADPPYEDSASSKPFGFALDDLSFGPIPHSAWPSRDELESNISSRYANNFLSVVNSALEQSSLWIHI